MAEYIKIDTLKDINNNIESDTQKIENIYKNTIAKALESCQQELKVSGLNYEEMTNSINKVFTTVVSQLDELTTAMSEKILPKYEATTQSVVKIFNQDFANEISEYLKIINSD